MEFLTNNTLNSVGNYRIITYVQPLKYVVGISGFSDVIYGGIPGTDLERYFRFSTDSTVWSLWIKFDLDDVSPITSLTFLVDNPLYVEFKYVAIAVPGGSPELNPGDSVNPPFIISSVNLSAEYGAPTETDPYIGYVPASRCSDEYCQIPIIKRDKFTFDPYAINKGLCLYKELSQMTNEMFGHEVVYYRVNPQGRSADVVLKEWTIQQVEQQKCLKILVPNNEFPDSKPQFNSFGIDFEIPFEIHIDKGYWEKYFGLGSMPQEFDIIYFPLLNRLYEIQSTYIYRDFMQAPLYFKAQLIKYQKRASVLLPDNIAMDLDNLTISTDELFADEMEREIKRITKPEQYVTITHAQDPTRYMVNKDIPIVRYELQNHWTLVSEHFYDLDALYASSGVVDAVVYHTKAALAETGNLGFTFWFKPRPDSTQDRPMIHSIQDGIGLDIDFIFNPLPNQSAVRLTINASTYIFTIDNATINKDTWYGLVVNVSNQFAQAGVNLWRMQDNTTDMLMIYSKTIVVTPETFAGGHPWKLTASPLHLTNVRVFGLMLDQEKQNLVLNQMIVQDSDEAIVIDNAKPLLRLPRITNPK